MKEFVKKNKLSHRILLNGGAIGRTWYGLSGIPVNFWIDREGRIVGHEIGFKKGEERKLERITADLL